MLPEAAVSLAPSRHSERCQAHRWPGKRRPTLGAVSIQQQVTEAATRARTASRVLALATRAEKDAALTAIADALTTHEATILAANAEDVERAEADGTRAGIIDRLRLDGGPGRRRWPRACGSSSALPDPVGEVVRGDTLANGLELRQVRVPFGVVGMIYEARPNVTADAAGICLKSGNAVLLRGSSSARRSNAALVDVLRGAVDVFGLPADAVQLVPGDTHESVKALMRARGLVDVLIPRGGAGLIRTVVEESTVPVIETGVGNCHVYVDRAADLDKALDIVVNAKTQRTSVCNAAESLLVHAEVADAFVPRVVDGPAGGRRDHPRRPGLRGVRRGGGRDRRRLGHRVPRPRHRRRGRPRPRRRDRPHPCAGRAGTPRRS